jgi:hypothetical protein
MEIMKYLMIFSSILISYSSEINGDILPIGPSYDNHNCLISEGDSWCQSSNSCIRHWETPCEDDYNGCQDCFKRQQNGENIACPAECNIIQCQSDKECDETKFCRQSTMNNYGPKVCVSYSTTGQLCGGYTLPSNENRCHPSLECVNTMGPYVADAPGNCMFPCNLGSIRDEYGNCNVKTTSISDCPDVMCDMYCENGFQKGDNGCNICSCDDGCSIPYSECNNLFACPKVTELTQCSFGGIDGYTTYQLSIVLKDNQQIKNIFAIYGSNVLPNDTPMYIPPAWHVPGIFGSNIGGISNDIITINPDSLYDSWLTIGITDGNINNDLNTIGIPFNNWNEENGIVVENGAIFLMNPSLNMDISRDIIVGQLTVPTGSNIQAVLNVQGKFTDDHIEEGELNNSWREELITFNLNQPNTITSGIIPNWCNLWYDGCNNCVVLNGQIQGCTKMMCFTEDTPRCLSFDESGH